MVDFKLLWKCLFSPSLYSIHRGSQHWGKYDPNDWERWGDNLVTSIIFCWNVGIYSSPVLLFMLARKGYFTMGGMLSLVKFSIGLSVLVGASYCIRSYGRSHNQKYRIFLNSLEKLKGQSNIETRKEIKNYDFEFSWWPIDYEFNEQTGDTVKANRYKQIAKHSWSKLVQSPCSIISYVVLHTFGIRLIYPGSIRALSFMMGSALNQGRSKLIETDNGERFKLKTSDGNYLDTMFIDKRLNSSIGKTLVICTEGNAGFYEYGIMVTPLEAGYSVLGWNHPGFAGSTGMPYPDQEQNGIDTVMQFAINKLGFLPDNIILFGWSIGGYATTWAAMNYPEVKAVILDATFDDLLPLAIPRMPAVLEPIVKLTIRQYANLDVARQLVHYPGPILLVRRANDEIICLEPNDLSTNRGNNLLVKLLRQRFPNLMVCMDAENALLRYLGASGRQQTEIYHSYSVDEERCHQALLLQPLNFPMSIGDGGDSHFKTQLILYLAKKYMVDYLSTHCTPLPSSLFIIPTLQSQI